MKKKLLLVTFLISLFLIDCFVSLRVQAQDNSSQLLANAVKEFAQANFDGAIQILNNIKDQPSLYKGCLLKDREKVLFYLSYCHYLLYGDKDRRTQRTLCDLKLHFPKFDPKDKEYQWVSQDWIDSLINSDCSDCDVIGNYYNLGKNLYNQNNYVGAVQELIYVRTIIKGSRKPPQNCPEYEQYKNFSEEYLNICQERIIDMWNEYFGKENHIECLRLEKQLNEIEGYQENLQRLSSYINDKRKEVFEKISQKTWQSLKAEIDNLFNPIDFIGVDPNRFQEIWNEIKKYNVDLVDEDEIALSLRDAPQEILNNFTKYGKFIIEQYDIRQEEKVRQSLDGYKDFIVNNFPETKSQIEKDYEEIINAPPPIFNGDAFGVKPPEKNWDWKIIPPDCMRRTKLTGYVRCGITINNQGKVEDVKTLENKLTGEKYCSSQFVDRLLEYLNSRKFTPAFKIKYKPASAPLTGEVNRETVNVKYYIEKRFVLE